MKKIYITLRIPENIKNDIWKKAKENGLSFNQFSINIIDEYINHLTR